MASLSSHGDSFADRRDAGRRLAEAVAALRLQDPLVLALPRGGVPVAFEVARALDAPLDVLLVRKIGAPHQPELGIGAVVEGDPHVPVLDTDNVRAVGATPRYIEAETARQVAEIARRRALYAQSRPAVSPAGRDVVVVDDGIATGGTARAALRGLAQAKPRRLVLAVPVAPPDTLEMLRREGREVVCLAAPALFGAVGAFYADFTQTEDAEVIALLRQAQAARAADHGEPDVTP